jgi:hypothetical protein
MARPFDFGTLVRQESRLRQHGRCACCGDILDDLIEHAHHVVPNQSGSPKDTTHQWLRSTENCVVLCEICHERVHQDGNYRLGAVAPPSYYTYSHGIDRVAHRNWVIQLEKLSTTLWVTK